MDQELKSKEIIKERKRQNKKVIFLYFLLVLQAVFCGSSFYKFSLVYLDKHISDFSKTLYVGWIITFVPFILIFFCIFLNSRCPNCHKFIKIRLLRFCPSCGVELLD